MRRTAQALAAVGLVAVIALLAAGWRPVVLLSDSMAPSAPAGSLLLARPVPAEVIEVGDVVTMRLERSGRVTHRVIGLEEAPDGTWARLGADGDGDARPGLVALSGSTLRAVAVVPGLGRLAGGGNPMVLAGVGLLLVGTAGLAAIDRRVGSPSAAARERGQLPTGRTGVDTRILALLATVEALAEDGMDPATLEALARARTGALLGVGAVEDSEHVTELDDGARFVVMALVDADPAALALVPPGARRAVAARDAVTAWWSDVVVRIPRAVRAELDDVLTAAAQSGGIRDAGPVD